jgi:hypothetical protein
MRFATLSLLVLALCSCGDGKGSGNASGTAQTAAASGSIHACDLLTEADAEKALGHKVTKLAATGGAAGYDICQYGWEGEHIADTGNVSVTLHDNPIAAFRKSVGTAGMKMETVPGLGDDAFWAEGLYVGKGNRTALYIIGGKGISDQRAAATDLARSTVGRL